MSVNARCPRPTTTVTFFPREGVLKYYRRNARAMDLLPIQVGDKGVVKGEDPESFGRAVVVFGNRTKRYHVIECADLVRSGSPLGSAATKMEAQMMRELIKEGENAFARMKVKQKQAKRR